MERARRSQRERTAETRGALVREARRLFGSEGFAAVGAERVVAAAGMSRGALYHQFADKSELFAAVLDDVEAEIAGRIVAAVAPLDPADTATLLTAGAAAFLDACSEPDVQRIVLLDGPAVLGWERWREICMRHTVGLIAALLADGMARGNVPVQPLEALTHVLVGATDEAALYVAQAADPEQARTDMDEVIERLARSICAPVAPVAPSKSGGRRVRR